jgi:hypothetical protein
VRDNQRADYEQAIAEQAALNMSLRELTEVQAARVAVLEKAAGQDSTNSWKPPSPPVLLDDCARVPVVTVGLLD